MSLKTTAGRRILTGTIAVFAVAAFGGSHGLTAHAAAAPVATTALCDEFGSCYDDGVSTAFNDPNSSWMSFWDENNGTSGYYDTNSGDLWSSGGGTGSDLGTGYDPSWSSYSGLYDPGSYTDTTGGGGSDSSGGGGSSDWSTYSGLYDPGTE